MNSHSTFFPFIIFSPARLDLKLINLSYFNRYSCVCGHLERNSSLSSSQSIHCGPRKIWRVLLRQNIACLASSLFNPLRDSLKHPTAIKTMNGELWSNVESRRDDEIMKKTNMENWFLVFIFLVGLLESSHVALPVDFVDY